MRGVAVEAATVVLCSGGDLVRRGGGCCLGKEVGVFFGVCCG